MWIHSLLSCCGGILEGSDKFDGAVRALPYRRTALPTSATSEMTSGFVRLFPFGRILYSLETETRCDRRIKLDPQRRGGMEHGMKIFAFLVMIFAKWSIVGV